MTGVRDFLPFFFLLLSISHFEHVFGQPFTAGEKRPAKKHPSWDGLPFGLVPPQWKAHEGWFESVFHSYSFQRKKIFGL